MKILYFSPSPHLNLSAPAGYGTHMREMIEAFRKEGTIVSTFIAGGELPDELPNSNSDLAFKSKIKKWIPGIIWQSLKDWRSIQFDKKLEIELEARIVKEKPDLIYERAETFCVSGLRMCKKLGIPHILEINAPLLEERYKLGQNSLFYRVGKKRECEQLKYAGKVITVSKTLKNYFVTQYKVEEHQIVVIHNSINPERINLSNLNVLSKQILFPEFEHPKIIGFVGSIFPWHGIDILIESVSLLQQLYPNICLLIVGSGEIIPDLKQLASKTLKINSYHFTGNIDHKKVFTYLPLFDFAAIPNSHWYGSPVKLFEYAAFGIPIVAVKNGPVSEIIEDRQNGYLILPQPKEMADTFIEALQNEALSKKMGERLKEKVMTEHTWQGTAKKVIALAKMLSSKRG